MGPIENMGPTGKLWYHALPSMRGENWIWVETGFRSGLVLVSVGFSRGSQSSQPVSPENHYAENPIRLSSEIPSC